MSTSKALLAVGLAAASLGCGAGPNGAAPGRLSGTAAAVMGPGFGVPQILQLAPAGAGPGYDGSEYCGPTDLAMVGRAEGLGRGLTDAAFVQELAGWAGTDSTGSTPDGLVAAAHQADMDALTALGAPDFDWIRRELADGRGVILRGDYDALPPHQNPDRYSGHYILVTGWSPDLAQFLVNDPADINVRWESSANLDYFVRMHSGFSSQSVYEIAVGAGATENAP